MRDPEALIIYVLCLAVSTPFVVAAIVRRAPGGAGTTLCALLVIAGIVGIVKEWRTRPRLPRARCLQRQRSRPRFS